MKEEWKMRFILAFFVLSAICLGQAQDPGSMSAKVDKTDVRLTDARTPKAHTHVTSDITDYSAPAGSDPFLGWHPIVFIKAGTCPAGWTEVAGMDGFYVLATKAADGDVGTTVAASTSLTAAAQTFTGDATTVPALAAGTLAGAAHTHTFTAGSNASSPKLMTANTSSGVAASGTTGAASSTAVTGSTASGTLTPLGHNAASAVTGTVTPASYKMIPCEKQ